MPSKPTNRLRGPGSGQPNLLKFHRPRTKLSSLRDIPPLKTESKQCLQHLAAYRAPRSKMVFPRSRSAAVLVALFAGRMGDLYVLLSRRSSTLRTYAGDTSLPGGKAEVADKTIVDTARREAFEEIGLPLDPEKVPLLCVMEPFLARNQLIVTPVVVIVLDKSLEPILNASEVVSVFSHPLASFLSSEPPFPAEPESVEVAYHTYSDVDWVGWYGGNVEEHGQRGKMRMHRFLTGREAGGIKPIFGLTAAILLRVAIVGYAREPDFAATAPDAPTMEERIAFSMLHHPKFREAFKEEGLDPNDRLLMALSKERHRARAQKKGRQGDMSRL